MPDFPTGTVTFLFTDIEGSTKLWEQHPRAMEAALSQHDALLRAAIEKNAGYVFKTGGDAFCAVFAMAPEAVSAAIEAQRGMHASVWGEGGAIRVRMALHTGAAEERGGDYFGLPLSRVARLLTCGHGGQTLLSQATCDLVRDGLPEAAGLRDLGAHRLKDLQQPEHVFQLTHPDLPSEFPPLRSLEAFTHNLPRLLTSFVGREREVAEVKRLLSSTALLTLTGSGGCGKTRLALQAAVDLVEEFAGGVWLVELAALAEPALVPQTVATALGVREEPGRPLAETLIDALRPRLLLLVLDNCEHLVGACAELAERLLRSCPDLRILATSREALGVAGETPWQVPPLSIPDPRQWSAADGASHLPQPSDLLHYESVRLFVERAQTLQAVFVVTPRNAAALAQVCHRLDGIPLALELAAARVKALPVEQIAARMDDFFRLLTGGSRTALPRQQTLRATIDWSYNLLTEAERYLLRRLSVFSGGWTLEAAETVCSDFGFRISQPEVNKDAQDAQDDLHQGESPVSCLSCTSLLSPEARIRNEDVLDLLTALVDKSLVIYDEQGQGPRYRLLETVRQYARDRLLESGDGSRSRDRHLKYFQQLAERAAPELSGPEVGDWLNCLAREHDNFRSALAWCRSAPAGAEAQLRLAAALGRFWFMRGHFREGRQWLEEALSGDCDTGTQVPVEAPTRESDVQSFSLRTPARARVEALLGVGHIASFQGENKVAGRRFEECLELARAAGLKWQAAMALFSLAIMAAYAGNDERAAGYAHEALALSRETGDVWLISRPLVALGAVALGRRDYAAARSFLEEGLALSRKIGDRWHIAQIIAHLGGVLGQQGEHEQAKALYQEGLVLCGEIEDRRLLTWYLVGLAGMTGAQGKCAQAARLLGAAEALLEALGSSLPHFLSGSFEPSRAAALTALGQEAFRAAWEAGRMMTPEQAAACAVEAAADDSSNVVDGTP